MIDGNLESGERLVRTPFGNELVKVIKPKFGRGMYKVYKNGKLKAKFYSPNQVNRYLKGFGINAKRKELKWKHKT